MNYKIFKSITAGFFISFATSIAPARALEPTPIRISIYSHRYDLCSSKNTTIGLDLGLWRAATCEIYGIQLAPGAEAFKLHGVQISIISSFTEGDGYGIQISGLMSSTNSKTKHRFYGIQASGIYNNLSIDGSRLKLTGLQLSGIVNLTREIDGVQKSAINLTSSFTGLQAGLLNAQDNLSNPSYSGIGAQFGIYNCSEDITGLKWE